MPERGRPTKYKPEYCELVVEYMAKGFSLEAFAGHVDVNSDTVHEWKKVHPDFSDAVTRGVAKCREFWEELGIQGLWNISTGGGVSRSMNSTMWTFNMKNRFKWRDQIDVKSDEKVQKTITLKYALPDKPKKDE